MIEDLADANDAWGGSNVLAAGQEVTLMANFDDFHSQDRPDPDSAAGDRRISVWRFETNLTGGAAPVQFTNLRAAQAIPEPSSALLSCVAWGVLALARRRRA